MTMKSLQKGGDDFDYARVRILLAKKVILDFHTKDHPYMIHPRTYRLLFLKQ
jgi:hypothetical protein